MFQIYKKIFIISNIISYWLIDLSYHFNFNLKQRILNIGLASHLRWLELIVIPKAVVIHQCNNTKPIVLRFILLE